MMIRRIFLPAVAAGLLLLAGGCKKNDNEGYQCTSCASTPEAKAALDASSAGVYKGIITGSSGTLVFYISNGNTEIKALVAFDGKSAVLTSTYFSAWTPGEAINNAVFTGTLNGQQIQATLQVGVGGINPSVNLIIPGHTISVAIFKETSTMLVRSFEGSFTGDVSGALNIVMAGDTYTALTNGQVLVRSQKLADGKVAFTSQGVVVSGEFSADNNVLKGTWQNDSNQKGAWEAKRTL